MTAPHVEAQGPAGRRAWLTRWGPWVVIAALLVVFGIAADGSGPGSPLDPNGTGPDGAKALVLLLRQYGATVTTTIGLPPAGAGTALVLSDQLDDARRSGLEAWVQGGGQLVLTDPTSPLQIGAATDVGNGLTEDDLHPSGRCGVSGLTGVDQLSVGPSLLLVPPPGSTAVACFDYQLEGHQTASFLLAAREGRGTVIALGGAGVWTNSRLDQADNAALAVDLMAPNKASVVTVLLASPAGSGTKSLLDLINPRAKTALIELLVAFAVFAWWRGRRLGRPVDEHGVVQVAASEIVVAVGDLLARSGSRDAAAHQLRGGCRSTLGERLGIGARATVDAVADAASARTTMSRAEIAALLTDAPVADDAALVTLGQSLAQLRQEVLGAQSRS